MRRIDLVSLYLRNFKGIQEFMFDPQGADASVFGDNAVGKTTLFDAFTWVMFDKDSANKTDFGIKTLDAAGNVLHKLEHAVECTLLIDGHRRTLRKVLTEKWTRKRGSAAEEFTGHTTEYFIDGVPSKAKEFSDFVGDLVRENIFKLLTNPAFFNEQLHWTERRKILLEVCGDVLDADVIAASASLSRLPDILDGRTIDQHRKVIAARRTEINKELDTIPVRIDEATRSMPDTGGQNEAALSSRIAALNEQIGEKQAEISRIQSGGQVAEKEKRIREIEGELQQLKNQIQGDTLVQVAVKRQQESAVRGEVEQLTFELESAARRLKSYEQQIEEYAGRADRMREKWHAVNNETFQHEHDENCPSCGQALPNDRVKAVHDAALAAFNQNKAERLEEISKLGKQAKQEGDRLTAEKDQLSAKLPEINGRLDSKKAELQVVSKELATIQSSVKDVEDHPAYIQKLGEAAAVRKEISGLHESAQSAVDAVRSGITDLRTEVHELEQERGKFAVAADARKRIADLEQQEKTLAKEYELLEHVWSLTEEFIRTKVTMLETRINDKFRFARFKLFETQINGGISEVCETLYEGVPYGSGLNNAARINVGLDIINTLSEHHEIAAPIFIDNAEAVTRLVETRGQQLRLVVSEADKQLRVEIKSNKEAVSA